MGNSLVNNTATSVLGYHNVLLVGGEPAFGSLPQLVLHYIHEYLLSVGGGGAKLRSSPAESKVFVYKLVGKERSEAPLSFLQPIYYKRILLLG